METKNIRTLFNDKENIDKEIERVEKYSKIIINKLALLRLVPKNVEQIKKEIATIGQTAEAILFYRDHLIRKLEELQGAYETQE